MKINIKLPEPPEGKEYRSMGVMEHNIDINFERRLKGKGKCWSINGVNKMAKILAIKANKGIPEVVDNIVSFELSAEKLADIKEEIKIKKCNKKIYPTVKGKIPYQDSSLNPGRKQIKKIINIKNFSEMLASF